MLTLYKKAFSSRLLLGSAQYPSPAILQASLKASKAEILTLSLRRETANNASASQEFWQLLQAMQVQLLPNTAGCSSVKEAVLTAHLAQDLLKTNWVKLEIIGHHDTLQPNVFELVEAARILTSEGFCVFPYTTEDLIVAEKLLEIGCQVLMPWCAPIGSARGPQNVDALKSLRRHCADIPLIIDAGIGRPSHASQVMELGYDAVLLNTAVARAQDPVLMAQAFSQAIEAGRLAYKAGILEPRDMAVPSTPVLGLAALS